MSIRNIIRRQGFPVRIPRGVGLLGLWGAAAIAAAVYAWALLPWGPWAFTDSAAYVDVARNLYHGVGLYAHTTRGPLEFLAHYPPGYPLLLAGGMALFQGDWLTAATWLDVVSLFLFLAVMGTWLYEATGNWSVGLLGMVVLAGFWPITRAFLGVMSEPPFMVLEAASGYLLWRYVSTGHAKPLWWAALLAGLAVLIRYGGIAEVLAFGLAPLLFSRSFARRRRWGEAVGAAFLVALPFVLWWAYLAWRGDTAPRSFTSPEVWLDQALFFVTNTARAFVAMVYPSEDEPLSSIAVWAFWGLGTLVCLDGLRRWRLRRWTWADDEALVLVSGLLAWAWFPALGAMRMLVVPSPAIDVRMYTPAVAFVLVAGMGVLWFEAQARAPRWERGWTWSVLLLAVVLIGVYVKEARLPSHKLLFGMRHYGLGYTAKPWHRLAQEGALRVVSALPEEQALFSNQWAAVLLWTGRPARVVNLYDWLAAAARERLSEDPRFAEWQAQHGALVLLWPREPVPPEKINALLAKVHALPCYRDERGWIEFPRPPLPAACPGS